MIDLPKPTVMDIGSWPEGANPWDGADVDVIAIPEETFLSRHNGYANLFETAYPGCSSLFEPDPEVIDRFSQISTDYNFKVTGVREVQTHTLDSLGLRADLIKLDVQGSELDILRGGRETLHQAIAVQAEVEFLPLYQGQPTAGDVFKFMENHGFYLHQLRDCGGSPFKPFETSVAYLPASQLLYADAVFLLDFNLLTAEQRLKMISILWNVYKSYDLAVHLMAAVDVASAQEMIEQVPSTRSTAITMKAKTT